MDTMGRQFDLTQTAFFIESGMRWVGRRWRSDGVGREKDFVGEISRKKERPNLVGLQHNMRRAVLNVRQLVRLTGEIGRAHV